MARINRYREPETRFFWPSPFSAIHRFFFKYISFLRILKLFVDSNVTNAAAAAAAAAAGGGAGNDSRQIITNETTSSLNRAGFLDFSEISDTELAGYRLRCGVWITFVLATGFVSVAKFYFGHRVGSKVPIDRTG